MMLPTKYQGTRHCRFRQEDLVRFFQYKSKVESKTQKYNQVPQLTRDTIREGDKIQEHFVHKRAKRSALS